MILDAKVLSTLQACGRRFLLDADWEVVRWRPKALHDACLRVAVRRVSQGEPPAAVAEDLRAQYLQAAANPGLDLPPHIEPYKHAKEYCVLLGVLVRAAARWGLPALHESPAVSLNTTVQWRPLAFEDPAGELHRIITIDRWGEDDLSRELHSWYTFGDIAILRRPLTIHVVEIGRLREGRRASLWVRGWRHPTMPNLKMHFVHDDGRAFEKWKPMYLADYPNSDVDAWVAQLYAEGAAQPLVHTVRVQVPSAAVCEDTVRQVLQEAARASVLLAERGSTPWSALPMVRAACDSIIPCPYQPCCHNEFVTDLTLFGLYAARGSAKVAVRAQS